MSKYFLILLLPLAFAGTSCKKNTLEAPLELGLQYMPLQVGNQWTYAIDSIVLKGTGALPDTFNYLVRYTVDKLVDSSETERIYRVEVEEKWDSISPWTYDRSFSFHVRNNEVLRKDNDQTELILDLPLLEFKNWDGNAFNNQEISTYYVIDLEAPKQYDTLSFANTVTIDQIEQSNLVNSYIGHEVYAKDIGMVFKYKEHLSNLLDPSKTKGVRYSLTLLRFEL